MLHINEPASKDTKMLKLLPDTDPILHQVAEPVTVFDEALQHLAVEMQQLMVSSNGVGLAAPQVGVSKRLIVHDLNYPDFALVNPRFISFDGVQVCEEGCLSFPGLFFQVQRAERIEIQYQTVEGTTKTLKATGFDAVVFQHELDHLDGILFVDKLKPIQRALVLKNWKH
jgi:peptide deformylase